MTTSDYTIRTGFDHRRSRAASLKREAAVAGGASVWLYATARGLALFFGLFSLVNFIGEIRTPGFDQNIWWLDLRPVPAIASALLLALAGTLLVWWGVRPAASGLRRTATLIALIALTVVAIRNGVTFYRVWGAGQIRPWMPLPLSFVFGAAFLSIVWAVTRPAPPRSSRWTLLLVGAAVVLCGLLFPLAQQAFFGKTTYLRPAQVAVVFGAQVHTDGRPSVCLRDRVRTAAQLYQAGLAERLLMSGAQGTNEPVNETRVMRQLAISFGVPSSAIDVDPTGFNTEATVRDTVPLWRASGYRSIAVVSDFFHLPRIKLAYQRFGYDVITVPSHAHRIPQTTQLVIREIPAFWVYYLRAVLR